MSTFPAFIEAGAAKASSQDAAMLSQAARKAQGALQWGLAASLFSQAADALPLDPHTSKETLQAQAHRRSARTCQALVGTNAPNRLIKDAVGYGAMQLQHQRAAEVEQDRFWSAT